MGHRSIAGSDEWVVAFGADGMDQVAHSAPGVLKARCGPGRSLRFPPISPGATDGVVPWRLLTGAALAALRLSEEARGVRGLDVLRRSVDRAPPVSA